MRISIFGMGYVGAVCAACLAEDGNDVIGVDISALKVELINRGKSPVVEPGLDELLKQQIDARRLRATSDLAAAVRDTDLTMICVGTPSKKNGDLDLQFVEEVCAGIGAELKEKATWHTVAVRSTVLPGTIASLVIPTLELTSGKVAGVDFGVAVNPEFLRESTAIRDYREPPMTVIGELNERSGEALAQLYSALPAPMVRRPIEVAEMVKYACNAWHATKITFANEIGAIAKAAGVDGRAVMNILCLDTKLNLSPYYMRPGFAFGGSCLPKDLRALTYRANQLDVESPLLSSILRSNKAQIEKAVDIVASFGKRRIGLLGLSFKAETDDLRESPLVELAETLIGKGYELSIFDRNVDYARVHGANRDYINARIPHVSSLLKSDIDDVIANSDVMVVGNRDYQFAEVLSKLNGDHHAVDLVGFMGDVSSERSQGICW
ncbi:MAG TPA: UDP-glucose/GDP-mannose dehydrogenase family protein [Fontimonas sp.]